MMNNTHGSITLLAISLVTGCFLPGIACSTTLKECVISAIANSPGLSAEHHLIAADDADVSKKRATTLPYLSSQIQGYEVNGMPVTPWVPSGVFQPENGVGRRGAHWAPIGIESIGVTYPIIYEGSVFGLNDPPAVAAARAQMTQEELVEVLREQKIVFDVVSDFIRVASYRQQIAIYNRILALSRKELGIIEEQVHLGHKLPQEEQIFRSELSALEYARSAIQENTNNFASDLANMVGGLNNGSEDRAIQIDDELPQLTPLPPLSQLLDQVMPGHPVLLVENTKTEIVQQQLRVDEANRWPTASFSTSFGAAQDLAYFSGSATHLRPTAFEAYLTLTIPLYDFGGRQAAVRESRENLAAQKKNLEQLDLEVRSSITQEYGEILQDTALMLKLQSGLEKDNANLDLVRAQLDEGKVDRLTALTAESVTLQEGLAIQAQALAERLKYAELQNLSAGRWRWAP
jgi:outer membrane protein